MNRMKPKIKALWVEALRSGEYKQGQHSLHIPGVKHDRFCCMGVLCDLAVKAGVEVRVEMDAVHRMAYDGSTGYPPSAVVEWAGLVDDGCVKVPDPDSTYDYKEVVELATLNDDRDYDFDQIADLIEESL